MTNRRKRMTNRRAGRIDSVRMTNREMPRWIPVYAGMTECAGMAIACQYVNQ